MEVLIGQTVVVLVGVAALWWIIASARSRRQLAALMSRVEELEQRLAASSADQGSQLVEVLDESNSPVSSDVLVGWTSHVGRMLNHQTKPQGLAEQAVVAVYRRIEDPIRPSDLAEELAVSLRTLQRGLMVSLDCSPSDLILTVKMREARRMLESGSFRVGDVAHRLAFADAAHFSRRYRKFYRCPPSRHSSNRDAADPQST